MSHPRPIFLLSCDKPVSITADETTDVHDHSTPISPTKVGICLIKRSTSHRWDIGFPSNCLLTMITTIFSLDDVAMLEGVACGNRYLTCLHNSANTQAATRQRPKAKDFCTECDFRNNIRFLPGTATNTYTDTVLLVLTTVGFALAHPHLSVLYTMRLTFSGQFTITGVTLTDANLRDCVTITRKIYNTPIYSTYIYSLFPSQSTMLTIQ